MSQLYCSVEELFSVTHDIDSLIVFLSASFFQVFIFIVNHSLLKDMKYLSWPMRKRYLSRVTHLVLGFWFGLISVLRPFNTF